MYILTLKFVRWQSYPDDLSPSSSMGTFSIANAELVGLWLQILLTGAYVGYLPRCAALLWRDYRARPSTSPVWVPIVCAFIFLFTISDQALTLIRAYQAFSVRDSHGLADPAAFFANPTTRLSVAKSSLNIVLPFISDTIIIYRTYVIWNRAVLVIVLPVCLVAANIALGVLALIGLAQGRINASGPFSTNMLKYYIIVTFSINVMCAGLITWKIWRVRAAVSRSAPLADEYRANTTVRRVLDVIVQTAGLYCMHLFVLIICWNTPAFFAVIDPLPSMTALVFSMLIVRARDVRSAQDHDDLPMSTSRGFSRH
ncbi:hypothetical protein C8Q76DRAFT_404473 [Earliella scabrosa]|nr:hypothetical protein C8Q76DRAFT_404473 [Earliella scabrosa]